MENMSSINSREIGTLGIFHIKRLWAMHVKGLRCDHENEGVISQFVVDGLELDTREVISFLNETKPTFSDFEAWILNKHERNIPSVIKEKVNRAVSSFLEVGPRVYPQSLEIEDPVFSKEDMEFWEKNGYIVLRNAIPLEDCRKAVNIMWDFLEMNPDEPDNWHERSEFFWIRNYQHAIFRKNRESLKIHKAFAQIWGTEALFPAVHSLSFNPPAKDGISQYGPSYLHWDASIAMPMPLDVIGLLYLNDVDENQGAFQCVPGFHHKMESWLASLPEDVDPRMEIRKSSEAVNISGKAGDLIISRQELPHGSSLNRGNSPRFVQYILKHPPDRGINPVWK